MSNESVKLILRLPDKCLSPNAPPGTLRGRMKKARIIRESREEARKVTLDAGIETGPWKLATIQCTFYHNCKRRRDSLNFMGAMKAAIDGIVDAGLLVDDNSEHLKPLSPEFKIDKACPRVEIIITKEDSNVRE